MKVYSPQIFRGNKKKNPTSCENCLSFYIDRSGFGPPRSCCACMPTCSFTRSVYWPCKCVVQEAFYPLWCFLATCANEKPMLFPGCPQNVA